MASKRLLLPLLGAQLKLPPPVAVAAVPAVGSWVHQTLKKAQLMPDLQQLLLQLLLSCCAWLQDWGPSALV
jgi:hypothetical protein